jgi:signal-transduction protein with cAMP-binding, CBS, and nucleotidyltransferase domain
MVRHRVSVVLVGDAAVTERDLVRALARGLPPDDAASEHAGHPAVALGPSASVVDAALAMVGAGAHHLVVIDVDRPIAMVTLADALTVLVHTGELPAWLGALQLALHVPH